MYTRYEYELPNNGTTTLNVKYGKAIESCKRIKKRKFFFTTEEKPPPIMSCIDFWLIRCVGIKLYFWIVLWCNVVLQYNEFHLLQKYASNQGLYHAVNVISKIELFPFISTIMFSRWLFQIKNALLSYVAHSELNLQNGNYFALLLFFSSPNSRDTSVAI